MPVLFQFLELLGKIKLFYMGGKYPHTILTSPVVWGRLFLNNVVGTPIDK